MHYWRLLLLAFLATLGSIAQADRLLVYGERRILQEQERFCGKEARSLARDTRYSLDGARNERSIQRERFVARTVTSQDNSQRNAADRRSLDRDNQHQQNQIRSTDGGFLKNQITRERFGEKARELRSFRGIPRRESREQRLSRDVRQNSHDRAHIPIQTRSERDQTKETQGLTESRRTREIHGQRENDIKRTTLAQQSSRERIFTNTRSRSFDTTERERGNINDQRDRELNSRQSYRATDKGNSRSQQNVIRIFTQTRGRSSELTRKERDRELNIRQSYRATEGIASRSQQNENRIFTNSRGISFERTRGERENINEQRDRELNSRQSYRDTERIASKSRQGDNWIESRKISQRDTIYDNRRIRDVNRSSIRRVRNFDGERSNSRFTREERKLVRVQSIDRRHSDAQIRQESQLIGTNERDSERNTETRRVRLTERKDFRQMDRRMATGPIAERVIFGNRQHPNQKHDIQSTTFSITNLLYTLQGLYICCVLFNLAGIFKNEKNNCGFLHFLTPSVEKEIKVD